MSNVIVPVVDIKSGAVDIEISYHNKVAVLCWLYGYIPFGSSNRTEEEFPLTEEFIANWTIYKFKSMGYQITDTSKPLENYFELAIFKDDSSLPHTIRVTADSLSHCLIKLVCYFIYATSQN